MAQELGLEVRQVGELGMLGGVDVGKGKCFPYGGGRDPSKREQFPLWGWSRPLVEGDGWNGEGLGPLDECREVRLVGTLQSIERSLDF